MNKPHLYESLEQEKLFLWASMMGRKYSELKLMYHIPNGGSRNKAEAAHLKRQGVKPGVPDVFLSVSRGGYHGLYIEMKVKPNKPTAKQIEFMTDLRREGYAAIVCYSADEAIAAVEKYFTL